MTFIPGGRLGLQVGAKLCSGGVLGGVLVRIIEHHAANYSSTSFGQGSEHDWDLRNRNNQVVASRVYFWHVEAGDARKVGRFTVVNFAQ